MSKNVMYYYVLRPISPMNCDIKRMKVLLFTELYNHSAAETSFEFLSELRDSLNGNLYS